MKRKRNDSYDKRYRASKHGKITKRAWLDKNKPSLKIINSAIFLFGY